MTTWRYSATMVSQPFWFLEFKKTVRLLQAGMNMQAIKELNRAENIYNAATEYRAQQIFNCVSTRIQAIGAPLLQIFAESKDVANEKVIVLISIMATERLFFEFMYEVYREKLLLGDPNLNNSDLSIFFANKQSQSETVAKWTDTTIKRLSQCYTRVLFEAGLVDSSQEPRKVVRPLLNKALTDYLKQDHVKHYLLALTGEN